MFSQCVSNVSRAAIDHHSAASKVNFHKRYTLGYELKCFCISRDHQITKLYSIFEAIFNFEYLSFFHVRPIIVRDKYDINLK